MFSRSCVTSLDKKIIVSQLTMKHDGKNIICVSMWVLMFYISSIFSKFWVYNLYSTKFKMLTTYLKKQTQLMFLSSSFITGQFTFIFKLQSYT